MAMLDRMSDALSLLAAPLIDAAGRLGAPEVDAVLERPADPEHGDYATTLALRLAKPLRRPPREIAEELATAARASDWVESADVAGPGFVNVRVSPAWYAEAVRRAREPGYGGGTANPPQRVNVEYVSANPTGLLPVSAGRNAAYGDSLARLFAFAGHDVDARVLLQRLRRADRALRPLAARPRPRRAGAGGRLPGRDADPAREGHRPTSRRLGRGVRPRRRRAHVRGHQEDARALPGADGRLHERGRSAPAPAASSARSSVPRPAATCSSRTGRRGCGRASSATTRTAR